VSSGDGGVFPADLLIGQVALGSDRRLRVRLAADYSRLEFLRILRAHAHQDISDPGGLLIPEEALIGPVLPRTAKAGNDD
jgi:rod shape-determining protein MreC